MEDIQLTPEVIKAVVDAFDEWALSRSKELTEKEHQKDIVDAVVDLTSIKKSDIMWMFKARADTEKTKEEQEKIDDRIVLLNTFFGN